MFAASGPSAGQELPRWGGYCRIEVEQLTTDRQFNYKICVSSNGTFRKIEIQKVLLRGRQ